MDHESYFNKLKEIPWWGWAIAIPVLIICLNGGFKIIFLITILVSLVIGIGGCAHYFVEKYDL